MKNLQSAESAQRKFNGSHLLLSAIDICNCCSSHILLNFTRDATLKKHPEIAEVLNLLDGKLSTETMQQLNAKVDVDKQDPQDVADAWLKAQGLIK